MKHNLVAIGLLAGGLISSHSSISEAAVERVKYRGEIASLRLFHQAEITCEDGSAGVLDTAVALQLFSEGVRSSLGDSDNEAIMLFFSERSSCTGIGREFLAFETPEEYRQQRVNSASFAHSFAMVDVFTGEPIGTLTLDVELDGVGPTGHINTHTRTTSGDFTFHSHVNGAFRQATASGTVDLDGLELINSGQSGDLSDIHSGDTTITH
jgi:hypothetical protein